MIACDEDDDNDNDNDTNSFLNETGSTHPDSFFLDESSLSLSNSIVFDEARIPRVPLQQLQEPTNLRPERKPIMAPTETVVGIWPPAVSVSVSATVSAKDDMSMTQEQREDQVRRLLHPPLLKKEQDQSLPFPIRPPKIRRLTRNDALSIVTQRPPSPPPRQRFGYHPPCHDSTTDTVYRSRSLDFLFPSKRHVRCKRENTKQDAGPRREHDDGL